MTNSLVLALVFLLLGLLIGALTSWLIAKFRMGANSILRKELKEQYVLKEIHDALQVQADLYRDDLLDKEEEIKLLTAKLSSKEQLNLHLEEKLEHQKAEFSALQERSRIEFENIANRLLEEKSQKFTLQNQQQLQHILDPLREKIKTFEEGVEKRFIEETKDRVSLKKEIEHLRALNQQLSEDASNLANALKGDNKLQGDWGEFQLEMLLQRAGLTKEIHYKTQASFLDDEGRQKRPDFIINLPEDKHIIIDSKVSLTAYEQFYSCEHTEDRAVFLKAHLDSIKQHIRDLSSKNYQQLYQINSPDYLLLFIPLEPAFTLAVQEDQNLFLEALDRNIVLVSTSTLLATMRTVSYIWKQEKQKRSVLEIARQSGLLYDKLVGFVEDLQGIGQRLDQAQEGYHMAMNKLMYSKKKGDTLIGRAEKIKDLGAKASKSLPPDLLDE